MGEQSEPGGVRQRSYGSTNAAREPQVLFSGNEHSSFRPQFVAIPAITLQFERTCGEVLTRKQGRGRDFLLTPTAESIASWSESVLSKLLGALDEASQRLGRTLRVGTTEFTLGYFAAVWPTVSERLLALDVDLRLIHVRTRHFWQMLEENQVDVLCGGILAVSGRPVIHEQYDFLQFSQDSLALLTNMSPDELPVTVPVTPKRLRQLPLVVPESGIIVEFAKHWYGSDYKQQLRIAAEVDDIYYGLALLRLNLVRGVMLILESISDGVIRGALPGGVGPDLRKVSLASSFSPPLALVSGVVMRKGDRERYSADHPLNVLWVAFEEAHRSWKGKTALTAYGTG